MADPATRRAARERRRRRRLREEYETNQPPPSDADVLAYLDTERASIAAALDAELEKAQAKSKATLTVPLDPASRALIIESLLVEHLHYAGGEPMACALRWIDAVLRVITAHAPLMRGIPMTTVPALLIHALQDYRDGSQATLDAMIDNKPTGQGNRALSSAACERGLIAAWVAVLQQGDANSGAYRRGAAVKVVEELKRVRISRTDDAVRRIHKRAKNGEDSPEARQIYDAVLAALPEEASGWPRDDRDRWLRRQVEWAAGGSIFRS